MNNAWLKLLLFGFLTFTFIPAQATNKAQITPNYSLIQKLYCTFLGNRDVSEKYKNLVQKALTDHEVKNPESVPVKHMNNNGSRIALMDVSSFTAFGIWLQEEYFEKHLQEVPSETIFQIYHETAHYKLKHHQKLMTALATLCSISTIAFVLLYQHLDSANSNYHRTTIAATGIGLFGTIFAIILPYMVKLQEKAADIESAKTLIKIDQTEIVQKHIKILEWLKQQHPEKLSWKDTLWWSTKEKQIEYLTKLLEKK